MLQDSSFINIVLSTDSLSLPRPWNAAKAEHSPEQFFRYRQTYPYLLQRKLRQTFPDTEMLVTNLAQRASTISIAALKRMDLLSWMEPSACVIHHGIVDCWIRANEANRFRVSIEDFDKYVREILDAREKIAPTLPCIFLGIMPTIAKMLEKEPEQNAVISEYNTCMRDACRGRATFIDVERLYGHMVERVVHADGHHLSRFGHQLYSEELFRVLAISLLT